MRTYSVHESEHTISRDLGATLTDIGDAIEYLFQGERKIPKLVAFEIANTGTAFNAFALLGKVHPDGVYKTLLSGTDWDSAAGILKKVVGSPKNLANAATAIAVVDIEGLYAIKFQSSISGGTLAKQTGTATGQPADTQTVTIGAKTYTFDTVLVDSANHVLIGATPSDTLDNLIAAINGAAGAGTLYGTGTVAHTQVTAAAGAGDTIVVTANADIAAATATLIATTDTADNFSWGAATLADEVSMSATVLASSILEE